MALPVPREKAGLDEKLHRLDRLDDYIRVALCYPYDRCSRARILARILTECGLTHLVEAGGTVIRGYRFLGKGFSSIIAMGLMDGSRVAVKIRRLDSRRRGLGKEAVMLEYLAPSRLAPLVYAWRRDFIVMEYIGCRGLADELKRSRSPLGVARRVLAAAYLLDTLGVNHAELNRPHGHVYVCGERVVFIDFESAGFSARPRNFTSLAGYFYRRGVLPRIICGHDTLALLSQYKHGGRPRAVYTLLRCLREGAAGAAER